MGLNFLIIYNIVTYHLVKSLRPHWSFLGSPKVAFLEGKWDPGYSRRNQYRLVKDYDLARMYGNM